MKSANANCKIFSRDFAELQKCKICCNKKQTNQEEKIIGETLKLSSLLPAEQRKAQEKMSIQWKI